MRLARTLISIGAQGSRRGGNGGVRILALILATCLLGVAVLSVAMTSAVYAARDRLSSDRTPVLADTAEQATALWSAGFDVIDGEQVSVITVVPLSDDAPLPPGLSEWPEPGQAVLSPGLEQAGADEGILDRYGSVIGEIGQAGLTGPEEKLAYINPATVDRSTLTPITGFYAPAGTPTGDALFAQQAMSLIELLIGLVMIPALVLFFVAARIGSSSRDRRTSLLTVLGASRRQRALLTLGESAVPVLVGAGLSLALLVTCLNVSVRVPVTGYLIPRTTITGQTLVFLAWWAISVIAALILSVLMNDLIPRRTDGRTTRPSTTLSVRWAIVAPVALLVTVQGTRLLPTGTLVRVVFYYLTSIVTLLSLPLSLAVALTVLGELLNRLGRRGGSAAAVVSGAWLRAHPRITTRIMIGIVVAIGLAVQAQVWHSLLGDAARNAYAAQSAVGNSLQIVEPEQPDTGKTFIAQLPNPTTALRVITSGKQTRLVGPCAALKNAGLPCTTEPVSAVNTTTDSRLITALAWNGWNKAVAQLETRPTGQAAAFLVIAPDGQSIDEIDLRTLAWRTLPGPVDVGPVGHEWTLSSTLALRQGDWLILGGIVAVLTLLVAGGCTGVSEFLGQARRTGSLVALSGRRSFVLGTSAWSVFIPLLTAGGAGTLASAWLAVPIVETGDSHLSRPLLLTALLSTGVLATMFWVWATIASARNAEHWRPGDE